MRLITIMLALLLAAGSTFALDLTKIKFPLNYECHTEKSAGLFRESAKAETRATAFAVNRADKWQMRIDKLESEIDLKKYHKSCAEERAFYALQNLHLIEFNGSENSQPQFCATTTYSEGARSIESATYCRIDSLSDKSKAVLECGTDRSFYFDTDRRVGVQTPTSLLAFRLGFNKSVSINEIACSRLDR